MRHREEGVCVRCGQWRECLIMRAKANGQLCAVHVCPDCVMETAVMHEIPPKEFAEGKEEDRPDPADYSFGDWAWAKVTKALGVRS